MFDLSGSENCILFGIEGVVQVKLLR